MFPNSVQSWMFNLYLLQPTSSFKIFCCLASTQVTLKDIINLYTVYLSPISSYYKIIICLFNSCGLKVESFVLLYHISFNMHMNFQSTSFLPSNFGFYCSSGRFQDTLNLDTFFSMHSVETGTFNEFFLELFVAQAKTSLE